MKMFKGIIVLISLLSIAIGSVSHAQTIQNDNELLWEISGNGLKEKSYLYGSLHSNDKRLFRFSDSVYVAMNQVKAVVLETDVFSLFEDWDTRKEDLRMLFDNQGNPYTGSKEASKTIYGNEDGMPQFLDAYFLEYCYNAGKKFYALESVQDQLEIANEWMKPNVTELGYGALNFTQEKLIEFYLRGDISSLDRMMRVNLALYPGMYEDLIVTRNGVMLKGIDSLIKRNSVFCAIGAGHLSGEEGLINLLRKKGYRLRKVMAVFSEETHEAKKNVRSKKTYSYVNDTIGLMAIFPGKPLELKIWDNHPYLVYREMGQGNTYSIEIVPIDGSLSLEEQAAIYIASPDATNFKHTFQDDGSDIYEGLSDTYPEGMHWVRIKQSDKYLLILKAYGGNKFMNSNRPNLFFSKVWFE
jgi:uncharacterized protein YbaP (TraB family)